MEPQLHPGESVSIGAPAIESESQRGHVLESGCRVDQDVDLQCARLCVQWELRLASFNNLVTAFLTAYVGTTWHSLDVVRK